MRNFRTIINIALKDKIISKENYPFGPEKDNLYTIPTGDNIKKSNNNKRFTYD